VNKTHSFTLLLVCLALANPAGLLAQRFTVTESVITLTAAGESSGIAIGDLNGDGKADFVVLARNANIADAAIVNLGNGAGSYALGGGYGAGTGSVGVVIGDFNGDKKPDLAISNFNSKDVSLLLGNGDGSFQAPVSIPAGTNLAGIATADFNGDGKPDLAVAAVNSNQVLILLGNGDGTFQNAASFSTGMGPVAVLAVDVNGDGEPDLVVTDSGSGGVSILLSNGDGTFQAAKQYATGEQAITAASGDLNHDGKLDLAVIDSTGLSVLLGNGDGTFQTPSHLAAPIPGGVGIADFDGDGNLDIVVSEFAAPNMDFYLGNGDGTFQPLAALTIGNQPATLAVGDLNTAGLPDLVVANLVAPAPGGPANAIYFSVLINKTVVPTTPVINSVVNGASFQPGISASSWITIQGKNLSATTRSWGSADFVNNHLPTELDGVSVSVNGIPAYTYYISPGQLNVLSPDDPTTGPVVVQVKNAAGTSNNYNTSKADVSPAFFLFSSKYPAAVHSNGALVGPISLGASFAPAKPGETILLFGTGFGPTKPALPAELIVTAAEPLANTATVTLANENSSVQFAGLSGSGLDQINVVVPSDLPDGDAPLETKVNGVSIPAGLFITVHH
jgi:uncharacterized protein (TIGR03437 family)